MRSSIFNLMPKSIYSGLNIKIDKIEALVEIHSENIWDQCIVDFRIWSVSFQNQLLALEFRIFKKPLLLRFIYYSQRESIQNKDVLLSVGPYRQVQKENFYIVEITYSRIKLANQSCKSPMLKLSIMPVQQMFNKKVFLVKSFYRMHGAKTTSTFMA